MNKKQHLSHFLDNVITVINLEIAEEGFDKEMISKLLRFVSFLFQNEDVFMEKSVDELETTLTIENILSAEVYNTFLG